MFIVLGLYSRLYTLLLRQSVPPIWSIFNPTNTEVAQLSNSDARWVLLHSSRWGVTKNSAVALSSRNDMISQQMSARTNEGKTTLI